MIAATSAKRCASRVFVVMRFS